MNVLRVHDGCEEVRVEIRGSLGSSDTEQLRRVWQDSQSNLFWRRLVVDISGLVGYDQSGHKLLNDMHLHGAIFAASTPRSLEFLQEITSGVSASFVVPLVRRAPERAGLRPRHRAGMTSFDVKQRFQ